jgi:DnaK suppressor protein
MTEPADVSVVSFENGLSREQLTLLEVRLRAERATLNRRVASRRRALADVPPREIDDGDWAADSAAQSLAVRLVDRDAKMLHEIEAALLRLAEGAYGVCARSGEPIGFERLAARPWTRFAVAAKEEVERDRAGAAGPAGVRLDAGQDAADVDDQDRAA